MAKGVKAWLRMHPALAPYEIPTSEWSFYSYAHHYLDYVHPTNGGGCDASGSWVQDSQRVDTGFATGLKAFCKANNIGYWPTVWWDSDAAAIAILDDSPPGVRQTAIDNLVILATTRGAPTHDGPWDGVDFDLEKPNDLAYKTKYNAFLEDCAAALHAAGIGVCVTVYGCDRDTTPPPGTTYLYNFGDFAEYEEWADMVNIMCYQYGDVTNLARTTKGYYDWTNRCTSYALANGLSAGKLWVGIAGMCMYDPAGTPGNMDVPHAWLTARCASQSVTPVWSELNIDDDGDHISKCRWKFCDMTGSGERAFVMDDDTWRKHLEIIDRHGVAGVAMFAPGYEDPDIWKVVDQWQKRPVW